MCDRPRLNRDVRGRTTLMHASYAGDHEEVIRLPDEGVHPDARDGGGDTALMFAAMGGHKVIVRLLIARGADPLARANNGWTAMRFAVSRGPHEMAAQLHLAEVKAYRGSRRSR